MPTTTDLCVCKKCSSGDDKRAHGVSLLRIVLILVSASCFVSRGWSAPGDTDPTFIPPLVEGGFPTTVHTLKVQPDGRILIGGNFLSVAGETRSGIARLEPDGTLDRTFAPTNVPPDVRAIALQADGKVLVGIGYPHENLGTNFPSTIIPSLIRLNSDGSIDRGFTTVLASAFDPIFEGTLALLPQSDGRILVGGGTAPAGSVNLLRIDTTGTVDYSFSRVLPRTVEALAPGPLGRTFAGGRFPGGIVLLQTNGLQMPFPAGLGTNAVIHSLAVQPNGAVLVGGKFTKGLFTNIVRLNTNAQVLDMNFPVGPNGEVTSVVPDADNRIILAGDFSEFSGWPCDGLARLKATGELDTGFNPSAGRGLRKPILAAQSDGLMLVAGSSSDGRPIRRLVVGPSPMAFPKVKIEVPSGRVTAGETITLRAMTSFSIKPYQGRWRHNGTNILAEKSATLILTDVTVEQSGTYSFETTNLQGPGSGAGTVEVVTGSPKAGQLDQRYNTGTRAQVMDGIFALGLQSDGSAIVGGGFNSFNGVALTNLARVNANGDVDPGFNSAGLASGAYPAWVHGLARQNDGQFVAVGSFARHLLRLDGSGKLDASLPGYYAVLYAVAIQPDGKILIGTPTGIIRLLQTGLSDYSFRAVSVRQPIRVISIQPDGKILAGGDWVSTAERPALARLFANGDIDYSFNGKLTGNVSTVLVQGDGRVLVGGKFQSAGGSPRKGLARLNPDGSLDATFEVGTGFSSPTPVLVTTLALQPDGKVLVGGAFTSFNGMARRGIARLDRNGRLDKMFNPAPDGIVYAIGLLPTGDLIIAGDFTKVQGIPRDRLARIYGDNMPPIVPRLNAPIVDSQQVGIEFLSESGRKFTLEYIDSFDDADWSIGAIVQGDGGPVTLTDTNPPAAYRFYRVRVE